MGGGKQRAKPSQVFVVVLNYNGADDTIACVRSLQVITGQNLEIVLVDNASTDDSADRLRRAFPRLTLLQSPTNTGYAGGNNLGIRHALEAGAEYIMIMNNDVVVTPGFPGPMVEVLQNDPSAGVVTCKVFYNDRPTVVFAGAGRFNRWICTGMNKGGYLERRTKNDRPGYADFIPGVLFLARREVFETAGLFDERYFMYFEDVEFSRRVVSRYRVAYTPHATAYHKSGGGTAVRNYTSLYNYYHTRNRLLTFAGDPWFYRWYVVGFSLMNIGMKTLLQFPNVLGRDGDGQISALWRGFRDGLRMMRERVTSAR